MGQAGPRTPRRLPPPGPPCGPPSVRHGTPWARWARRTARAAAPPAHRGGPLGTAPGRACALTAPRLLRPGEQPCGPQRGGQTPALRRGQRTTGTPGHRHRAHHPLRRRPAARADDGLACPRLGGRWRGGTPGTGSRHARAEAGRRRGGRSAWRGGASAGTGHLPPSEASAPGTGRPRAWPPARCRAWSCARQVSWTRLVRETVWPHATAWVSPRQARGMTPPRGHSSQPPGVLFPGRSP